MSGGKASELSPTFQGLVLHFWHSYDVLAPIFECSFAYDLLPGM